MTLLGDWAAKNIRTTRVNQGHLGFSPESTITSTYLKPLPSLDLTCEFSGILTFWQSSLNTVYHIPRTAVAAFPQPPPIPRSAGSPANIPFSGTEGGQGSDQGSQIFSCRRTAWGWCPNAGQVRPKAVAILRLHFSPLFWGPHFE